MDTMVKLAIIVVLISASCKLLQGFMKIVGIAVVIVLGIALLGAL